MKKISKAFSLAEVLIAMGVIGVVAALTIPPLMINTTKTETLSRLKETVSLLEKATADIKYECDGDVFNCLTNRNAANDNATTRQEIAQLYKAKFILSKDCTGSTTGCFDSASYRALDGAYSSTYVYDSADWYANARFILNNGTTLAFDWDGYAPFYFIIAIDLNNVKPPNQLGKDTFYYYYDADAKKIRPRNNNDCTTSDYGFGCAKKIFDDNGITYY